MDIRPVLFAIGILLSIIAGAMALPALADVAVGNPDWRVFAGSGVLTFFIGGTLVLATRNTGTKIRTREAFLLTATAWVVIPVFAALPFMFSELNLSYTDAFFESMSGITTTGSTVITALDTAPPGILLWRALLQWLGGIGIIVMALSVLPFLQVGGMQLFRTEGLELEKALPRATQLATVIGAVYVILTLIGIFLLSAAGMTVLDSTVHAMASISTGGYSTSDGSVGAFNNLAAEIIIICYMIIGGLPFVFYVYALKGNWKIFFRDHQVRWFISILAIATFLITKYIQGSQGMGFFEALRLSAFNVVSTITGTGYTTANYGAWGPFAFSAFFFMMCIGGCASSTTCGIKVFRFMVLYEVSKNQIKKLLNPNGVFIPQFNGKPLPEGVPLSVMSFFFLFALCFSTIAIALQLIGLDFATSMSGAATAISNVGPGLGPIIGPAGTFQSLPSAAKWILCVGMVLGRLELFTLLVMFSPSFWRN